MAITDEQKQRFNELGKREWAGKLTQEEKAEWESLDTAIRADAAAYSAELAERFTHDPNANYPTAMDSLDMVGLNVKGQTVESTPEVAPLTEEDKKFLDSVANTGASVQALAEIQQHLMENNANNIDNQPAPGAGGGGDDGEGTTSYFSRPEVQSALKQYIASSHAKQQIVSIQKKPLMPVVESRTDWDISTSLQITLYCNALQHSIFHDAEYVMSVTYGSGDRELTRKAFLETCEERLNQAQRDPYRFFSIFTEDRV